MYRDKKTVCFLSVARIPGNSPLSEVHTSVSIGIIVDYFSGEIIDITTTFISDKVTEFLRSLVIGHNLHTERIEDILEEVEFAYNGSSKKAVCVCLKTNYDKYIAWRKEHSFDCSFLP